MRARARRFTPAALFRVSLAQCGFAASTPLRFARENGLTVPQSTIQTGRDIPLPALESFRNKRKKNWKLFPGVVRLDLKPE